MPRRRTNRPGAMSTERVYIALGSNLGARAANLDEAVRQIEATGAARVLRRSANYDTRPVGADGRLDETQPDFVNAVIEAETTLGPEELLAALKKIEAAMGREATRRCGPRIIDLDILLYDDTVVEGADLTIPHARMHEREFVLRPLAEIAPGALHPKLKLSAGELLARLEK